MKIAINSHRKIFAIQEEFSTMFPELTIAFYAKPSHHDGAPSKKLVMHSSRTLQDCRVNGNEGTIEVLPTMSVSDLKENLQDIFGLSAEIFPKPKNGIAEDPVKGNMILEEINR
ncbi:MAG: hypothetical protein NTW10_10990 [Bacteroidetes bacterium]|nr:hypothetical protein [Bacteroidota bacterium]